MGASKVVVAGVTKLDLTSDTVAADNLIYGYTAHDKAGDPVAGTLVVNNYYTGAAAPDSSVGSDGDLYLVVST